MQGMGDGYDGSNHVGCLEALLAAGASPSATHIVGALLDAGASASGANFVGTTAVSLWHHMNVVLVDDLFETDEDEQKYQDRNDLFGTLDVGTRDEIPEMCFSGCKRITSVRIGPPVTSIGVNAFYDCTALTSVPIPDSVTKIGTEAFGTLP